MKKTTIIPIASGKGGVGKTFFSANLAIALASAGHSTVAMDLDLGGSNLHTYLGISNKYPGIGDYLKGKRKKFENLIVSTDIPNLKFIPGDGRTPFMANIPFEQRLILLKDIQRISARYVVLDLGAGSSFNTLNFFGLSHKAAIITTFESPAVMNFLMFLKNFIFRIISSIVRHNKKAFNMVIKEFKQPIKSKPLTVSFLIEKIADIDSELALRAKKACNYYRPRIFYNMGEHPDELKIYKKIDTALKESLSLEPVHFGFVFYDDLVRKAAKNHKIIMKDYPKSKASQSIKNIAKRIINIWDEPVENSGYRLMEDSKKNYKLWK
ncbi:CobQ/CobB/MinD/ParA nucleotide binding domain-containing protein [Candidatus Magnetomoraceae bacterium gMMP-15]